MKTLLIAIIISFSFLAQAQDKSSPELVIHLLDYLAKDYGGAVQNGKVISQGEYSEQVEFIEIVVKNAQGFDKLKANQEFIAGVSNLEKIIKSKGSPDDVLKLARSLQGQAIALAGINVSPSSIPDLEAGKKIFQTSCTACHGNTGRGDGLAGVNLDPKPANFHDADLVWNSAPYKFFNTIRLGVPGTGMIAFPQLSDKDVWNVAFYIKSLGYEKADAKLAEAATFSIGEVSSLTDAELVAKLNKPEDEAKAIIGSIRAVGFNAGPQDPYKVAEDFMNASVSSAAANDYATAKTLALRAYLEGVEPLEPKMKANIPGFVEKIEGQMSDFRSLLDNKATGTELEAKKSEIVASLTEAKQLFAKTKMSPSVAFGAAFSIFLREGFEAILIIVILISILRAMNEPKAVKWVHAGWASAVAVGIFTWFVSGILLSMSGLSRELMEGSISILAVAVLLYVGFWLHRYSEMKKWRMFLESKLKHGLNTGSYLALALVAFMAVFREAFEVVLFLRAIWIDLDSSGQSVAGMGILSSIGLLIVLSYFAIKESKKLPLGMLFKLCSWTMMALAFVLMGKGLHSLQEAGLVGVTTFPVSLRLDLLGVYPSFQTLIAQLALILLFLGLFLWEQSKKKELAKA